MFSCEFCKIFKSTFFTKHLQITAYSSSVIERIKKVGGKTSSSAIIPVICAILGLLLLALLLIFVMYRKISKKVTRQSKSKANTVVVPTSIDRQSKQLLLESRNTSFDYGDINVKVEDARVSFENDGDYFFNSVKNI